MVSREEIQEHANRQKSHSKYINYYDYMKQANANRSYINFDRVFTTDSASASDTWRDLYRTIRNIKWV